MPSAVAALTGNGGGSGSGTRRADTVSSDLALEPGPRGGKRVTRYLYVDVDRLSMLPGEK